VRCTTIAANRLLDKGHEIRIMYRRPRTTLKTLIKEAGKKMWYNGCYDWLNAFRGEIRGFGDITNCVFDGDEIIVTVGMWCSAQLDRLNTIGNPKLQYIHGLTPWMPEVMKEALSLSIPKIAVSHPVSETIKSFGGDVLAVIHNGIDQNDYYPSVDEKARNGIGTIYSGHPSKDPDTVLKVFMMLRNQFTNVPQYIFGKCPRPAKVPRKSYTNSPSVSNARNLYSQSLIWIMASCSEGFGLPILEAMACGSSVVATDCGGSRDIINDGENGFLVEVGNVKQIVDRVKLLLSDQELRQGIVRKSKDTVNRFTWENSVNKLEAVLKSIAPVC